MTSDVEEVWFDKKKVRVQKMFTSVWQLLNTTLLWYYAHPFYSRAEQADAAEERVYHRIKDRCAFLGGTVWHPGTLVRRAFQTPSQALILLARYKATGSVRSDIKCAPLYIPPFSQCPLWRSIACHNFTVPLIPQCAVCLCCIQYIHIYTVHIYSS